MLRSLLDNIPSAKQVPPHNLPHHRLLPPRRQRGWVLQGHGVLALRPVHVALVFPSISAPGASAWHHGALCPYWPSGQSGKPTPQGQRQSVLLRPANRNSPAHKAFSVLSGNRPPQSPAERTLATGYHAPCAGCWLPPSRGAWGGREAGAGGTCIHGAQLRPRFFPHLFWF